MIEIKVNKEIRDVKEDFLISLSLNQLVWCFLGLSLSVAIGAVLYINTKIPIQFLSWIALFFTLPFGVMAFFKWHELPAGTAIKIIVNNILSSPIKHYGDDSFDKKGRKHGNIKNSKKTC